MKFFSLYSFTKRVYPPLAQIRNLYYWAINSLKPDNMARGKKYQQRKLLYWRAHIHRHGGKNLQQLLREAFQGTRAVDRKIRPDADVPYYQILGTYKNEDGFFWGDFITFDQDKLGELIIENPEAEHLMIEQLLPESSDGKKGSLLEGQLFFLCKDNHLIICQDQQAKQGDLCNYLNRFFENKFPDEFLGYPISLERGISLNIRGKIKGVSEITITAPLTYEFDPKHSKELPVKTRPKGFSAFILDAISKATGQDTSYNFNDQKPLHATVKLKWPKQKKETFWNDIDRLANTLDNLDEDVGFVIKAKDRKYDRKEIHLEHTFTAHYLNRRIDTHRLFERMKKWYFDLCNNHDI
ncbi:MAG: hypothetical protein Q7P63_01355 [Verrucomicrobiota bacterium JB022]|nr:hypothetical protein [Verrucomicrobiota bacterium JB022]